MTGRREPPDPLVEAATLVANAIAVLHRVAALLAEARIEARDQRAVQTAVQHEKGDLP